MAAGDVDQQPLPLFLRPALFHGVGATAHLLLALAVSAQLVFAASSRRGKEPPGFRWGGLAVRATWAPAASEVFLSAYSLFWWYLGNSGGGGRGTPSRALLGARRRLKRVGQRHRVVGDVDGRLRQGLVVGGLDAGERGAALGAVTCVDDGDAREALHFGDERRLSDDDGGKARQG